MKKIWWKSLRIKIVAWSFVPTVIILSAVAWFTFYSYQRVLGDLAIKQYPLIVQPRVQAYTDALTMLTNNNLMVIYKEQTTNPEASLDIRAQSIIDYASGLGVFDGGIYIVNAHGKIVKTQPGFTELLGQDWSNTIHFRSINESPNYVAYTDLISIQSSGKKIFCLGFAITGKTWEEFVGASYYCFNIYPTVHNAYYEAINKANLGPDFLVVDRNQQVVYSSDPSEMGKDLSGESYIQQLSQGESKSGRFLIGNRDMVASYSPISSATTRLGWNALVTQSWAEVMQPSLPYRQLLLVLLGLGVAVPVLVTTYGIRHITEPVQKLIRASKQVTAGQFKQRIEVKTGDEIETLADQFNLMSAELDDSYTFLEKKVADRTRELAILNSIISVANQSLNIPEILEDALAKTVEQMSFDAGSAFKFKPDSTSTLLVVNRGFEPAVVEDFTNGYASLIGQRNEVESKEVATFGIEDLSDEKPKQRLLQSGFQSLVYVPLITQGRELGFFILGKYDTSEPLPEEFSLLSSIGKQIGVAMENARLYEQAEQNAVAAERSRLARELHDAVTQTLFSANLIADVIPRVWKRNPEEGLQNLDELRQLTRGALAEMRTLLLEMRPESLERPDLKSLLTQLGDAFVGRVRVPLDLQIHGDCEPAREVKIVFYRVAQEALNNVAKHSGARNVDLRLECQPGQMYLCIRDDGLGFDINSIPPNHMGIAIMQERVNSIGAHLMIESQPGQGTTVELEWVLAQKDGNDEYTSTNPGDGS
jgi:nitrate/nitrite-specific signal transduction histidine kinase